MVMSRYLHTAYHIKGNKLDDTLVQTNCPYTKRKTATQNEFISAYIELGARAEEVGGVRKVWIDVRKTAECVRRKTSSPVPSNWPRGCNTELLSSWTGRLGRAVLWSWRVVDAHSVSPSWALGTNRRRVRRRDSGSNFERRPIRGRRTARAGWD